MILFKKKFNHVDASFIKNVLLVLLFFISCLTDFLTKDLGTKGEIKIK